MTVEQEYNYTPLPEPIAISEHKWPEGTLPLVATGTLTYNHESYIRECLDGILMQKTTFPVRVTIFEDASTDRTAEIVKEYKDKYPGLIFAFCQEKNTYGKGEIRRKALEPYMEARSIAKYIALCEGDDYWTDPMKLQRQVEFLEENYEYVAVAENGLVKQLITNREFLFSEESERDVTIKEMVIRRRFPTASVMYRSITTNTFHSDTQTSVDTILWCYLASKGKFRYLTNVSSVYNRGLQGVVEGTDKFKWATMVESWNLELIRLFSDKYFDKKIAIDAIWRHYREVLINDNNLSFRDKKTVIIKCFKYNAAKTLTIPFYKILRRPTVNRLFKRIIKSENQRRWIRQFILGNN